MTDYFERILDESNLLLSHKAIVKNESIENVFRRVNNFASNFYKKDEVIRDVIIVQLLVERRREPNYLLVSYENRQGWLYGAVSINTYTEIFFEQSQYDVEVTVKMYPTFPIFRRSKSRYDNERLTRLRKNAELTWIDFILEIFKIAGVHNYDEIVDELLPDEVLRERERVSENFRVSLYSQFTKLAIGVALIFLLAYIYTKYLI